MIDDWFAEEEEPWTAFEEHELRLVEWGWIHPLTGDCMWDLPPLVRVTDILRDFYITPMLAELNQPATPFLDLLREEAL